MPNLPYIDSSQDYLPKQPKLVANAAKQTTMSKKASGGFTLVEIMIVVVIIGLLAAMAIPAFQRVRLNSQFSALANDIRVFAGAFETYALEYGQFPADASTGALPAGVTSTTSSLDLARFTETTPVGGSFDWDFGYGDYLASISVRDANLTTEELLLFDTKFDDGNLSTGSYRGNTGVYVYILASNP